MSRFLALLMANTQCVSSMLKGDFPSVLCLSLGWGGWTPQSVSGPSVSLLWYCSLAWGLSYRKGWWLLFLLDSHLESIISQLGTLSTGSPATRESLWWTVSFLLKATFFNRWFSLTSATYYRFWKPVFSFCLRAATSLRDSCFISYCLPCFNSYFYKWSL